MRILDIASETTNIDFLPAYRNGYRLCCYFTPVVEVMYFDSLYTLSRNFIFKLEDGSKVEESIDMALILRNSFHYQTNEELVLNILQPKIGLNYRKVELLSIVLGKGYCIYCGCREVMNRITCLMCGGPYK